MNKYLNQHIFMSTMKQAFFMSEYGNMSWDYTQKTRELIFNRKHKFKTQLLGTYSKEANTWLWGWANQTPNMNSDAIKYAQKLKEWGINKNVKEFIEPELFASKESNPDLISLLAIGLINAESYYCGSHEHGRIYLIVESESKYTPPKITNNHFTNHITNVISQIPITSHRDAVVGFCNSLGWKGKMENNIIRITNPAESGEIAIEIDEKQRITSINTITNPKK